MIADSNVTWFSLTFERNAFSREFRNILLLTAVHVSPLSPMVERDILQRHLRRAIMEGQTLQGFPRLTAKNTSVLCGIWASLFPDEPWR